MQSFTLLFLAFSYHSLAAPLIEPLGVNTPPDQTAATHQRREVLQPLKGSDFTDNGGAYAAQVAVPMWMFAKDGDWVGQDITVFSIHG